MINEKLILEKLSLVDAHIAALQQLSAELKSGADMTVIPRKKRTGLTDEDKARIDRNRMRTILKSRS